MNSLGKTLGERIRNLRGEMTQQEVATALKVDKNTVYRWEKNKIEPGYFKKREIAEFFKVPLWKLEGFEIPKEEVPLSIDYLLKSISEFERQNKILKEENEKLKKYIEEIPDELRDFYLSKNELTRKSILEAIKGPSGLPTMLDFFLRKRKDI